MYKKSLYTAFLPELRCFALKTGASVYSPAPAGTSLEVYRLPLGPAILSLEAANFPLPITNHPLEAAKFPPAPAGQQVEAASLPGVPAKDSLTPANVSLAAIFYFVAMEL